MGSKRKSSAGSVPKTKCCESRSKCDRCPLRMLKEGTLPPEFAVRRRRLVHADTLTKVSKDELPKKGKKPSKKSAKATKSAKRAKRLAAAA